MHKRTGNRCKRGHLWEEHLYQGPKTSYCKACKRHLMAVLRRIKPEKYKVKRKKESLLGYYGITIEYFNEMLRAQDNKCCICKLQFESSKAVKPHVDHDHKTGKVRGLLCQGCNVGLGSFREVADNLIEAKKYLEKHN